MHVLVGTNCLLKHVIKRKLEGTGRHGDVSSYWVTLRKREDAEILYTLVRASCIEFNP